jgi:hypothetical protein
MNNSDDFPTLPTYQAAVEHHDSRKPYKRGKNKGMRPLGFVRRYDRSQIRMEGGGVNGAGGVVVCRYYNSDIIKFNPDNSIVLNHDGFESPSTLECMNRILYQRFKLPNIWGGHGGRSGSQPISKIGGKFYLQDIKDPNIKHRFDKTLTITPDNEIIGGATERKYVLDQQLMGQVRKYYADSGFIEFVKYYVQMNPRVGKAEDILYAQLPALQLGNSTRYFANKAAQKRDDFFAALNDATKIQAEEDRLVAMMPLAEQIAMSAAVYSWDRNLNMYQYINDFKKTKEFFYELCRYQYNEALFKQEVVQQGKVLVDDNSKYIQLGSDWALPF